MHTAPHHSLHRLFRFPQHWGLGGLFLLLALAAPALAQVPFGLYNTGVNNDGTLAMGRAIDLHYSLVASPNSQYTTVYVGTDLPGNYSRNTNTAQYVGVFSDLNTNAAVGKYDYQTTFNLGTVDPSTVVLTGTFAADDRATVLINGKSVPQSSAYAPGFDKQYSFSVSSGFVVGNNTLDFIVNNNEGQTGLIVDNIQVLIKPVLSNISPTSRTAGTGAFTLTINGTGFAPNSIVKFGGTSEKTTYVSATKLTATIPASAIASAGTVAVTVATPHVPASNSKTFTATAIVSALTLSPSTVTGGKTTTGTVTLNVAAPSGGAAVTLSINGSTAGTVIVPAGATSTTFTILTFPVSATTTATIGAALNGTTKTATLTITH